MDKKVLTPGSLSPGWLEFFILTGAVVLVSLVMLIWLAIVVSRKHPRKRRHHHHHHRNDRHPDKPGAGGIKELLQTGRHRRRREHRSANPTLAETGGLPPVRKEKLPPPP